MNELNSPSKKSNGCKIFLTILAGVTLGSFFACSSRITTDGDAVGVDAASADHRLPLISVSDSVKESWYELRSEGATAAPSPLKLSAKSCIDRKFIFGTTFKVLGQNFEVAFEEEADQIVLASIEDTETKLSGIAISSELKQHLCSVSRSTSTQIIEIGSKQYREIQSAVTLALSKITPDCREVNFDGRAAVCNLDAMMPQAALVKTEEFQKSMIRKWSRQPYILARRTGVVSTLARAATNIANDDGFAKFCKVLQFSLPEELPIVMTSRRWQSALCSGQSASRREAAFYGLAKGAEELDMLRELYEGTSRVGVLSVKIPDSSIPARDEVMARRPLRVIISPDDHVSQRLVDQAKKYLGRAEREDKPRRTLRNKRGSRGKRFYEVAKVTKEQVAPVSVEMCWHPVFSETYGLLRTADGMKLTGKGFNFECGYTDERGEGSEAEVASLSKYLLQSLSSETEFVLDNGQSKLLRLPEGNYRYTVELLPANPLDSEGVDEENVPKTTGEMNWDSTRRHLIRTW